MAEVEKKSVFVSKTFWINAATAVVGVLGYLAGADVIADNASLVAAIVAAQGVVNVVLRFLTWQPVKV